MIKDLDNNWEELKTAALYGTPDPVGLANKLAHRFLLVGSAQYLSYRGNDLKSFPNAAVQPSWEHFLDQILGQDHRELFYEFCLLSQRKSQIFPVNFLVQVLKFLNSHPELADYAFPLFGEAGQYLCRQNPDWHWLASDNWENPLLCKESAKRLFIYRRYLESKPNESMLYFLEHVNDFTEKEQAVILEYGMHSWPSMSTDQMDQLAKLIKPKNILFLYLLIFKKEQNEITVQSKLCIEELVKKKSSPQIALPSLKKNQKEFSFAQILEILPPKWITERSDAKSIFQILFQENLLNSFIEAIRKYKEAEASKVLSHWLIQKDAFKEDLDMAKLSSCLNFETFNVLCLEALRNLGGKIDLEAFLHFILAEKHFWSDELLIAILDLHQHERLRREYDLEVFYAMIPYRINPNSSRLEEIPKSLHHLHESVLGFENVLQFRRLLRK